MQRCLSARENSLLRRVLVGDREAVALCQRTRRGDRGTDREHSACRRLLRNQLHHAPALDHDRQSVLLLDRARGNKRRNFAERVTGEETGLRTPEALVGRERRAEHGRLREAGRFAHPRKRILADSVRRELQELGLVLANQIAAVGVADSLARKENRQPGGSGVHRLKLPHGFGSEGNGRVVPAEAERVAQTDQALTCGGTCEGTRFAEDVVEVQARRPAPRGPLSAGRPRPSARAA